MVVLAASSVDRASKPFQECNIDLKYKDLLGEEASLSEMYNSEFAG